MPSPHTVCYADRVTDYTGGTFDTFHDDRPFHRLEPIVCIAVDQLPVKPDVEALSVERARLVAGGWKAVTWKLSYHTVGYPYRVEYWGHR